jgi:flagellar motor protein MotB
MNRRRRRLTAPPSNSANVQQMMTLSLFIMLLAFFIVLNAISSYEELKTEKVKRSVLLAFSKDQTMKENLPSPRPDEARSMKEGHSFDRLDALFEAQIAGFEAVQSKSRGVMMVKVPVDKFTEAIMALDQKDATQYPSRRDVRGNFFLPTLVSILRSDLDGAPTRMEILFGLNGNPAELKNQEPTTIRQAIDQAGVLSQRLEKQGMPQKLLNIGLENSNPDFVNLVFRKYEPFSPVKVKEGEGE